MHRLTHDLLPDVLTAVEDHLYDVMGIHKSPYLKSIFPDTADVNWTLFSTTSPTPVSLNGVLSSLLRNSCPPADKDLEGKSTIAAGGGKRPSQK